MYKPKLRGCELRAAPRVQICRAFRLYMIHYRDMGPSKFDFSPQRVTYWDFESASPPCVRAPLALPHCASPTRAAANTAEAHAAPASALPISRLYMARCRTTRTICRLCLCRLHMMVVGLISSSSARALQQRAATHPVSCQPARTCALALSMVLAAPSLTLLCTHGLSPRAHALINTCRHLHVYALSCPALYQ